MSHEKSSDFTFVLTFWRLCVVEALCQLMSASKEPNSRGTTDTAPTYSQSPPFISTDLPLFLMHNKLSTEALVIPTAGLIGKESFPK